MAFDRVGAEYASHLAQNELDFMVPSEQEIKDWGFSTGQPDSETLGALKFDGYPFEELRELGFEHPEYASISLQVSAVLLSMGRESAVVPYLRWVAASLEGTSRSHL